MNYSLLFVLTLKSMKSRKFTVALSVFSIAVSVLILLSVEALRVGAKDSFTHTISDTDLVVGARSGSIQLLLYSVFRMGNATNNIDWRSFEEISAHPAVAWAIPMSLGDSHRGYRVMGTTADYFKHFRFGDGQTITFEIGRKFEHTYDAVIGAQVAERLGYKLGQEIVLSHGNQDTHFARHDDKPFRIVGILAQTGTPLDHTIHVSLAGIEALHIDWRGGVRSTTTLTAEQALSEDLTPRQITAFMLGLHAKTATFRLQRAINNYKKEPLLAILPGLALSELWQLVSVAEVALLLVSSLVLGNAMIGLITVILTGLDARRRELAILRALGASPRTIFTLLNTEVLIYVLIAMGAGVAGYYVALWCLQDLVQANGLFLSLAPLAPSQLAILMILLVSSVLLGALPGYRAYRFTLLDGMNLKH